MDLRIGFLNIYEGCSFIDGNNIYIPEKYYQLLSSKGFDFLNLVECPMDNPKGESGFIKDLSISAQLPYYYCHASDVGFIGPNPYSGIAMLSKYPLNNYEVIEYPNPNLAITKQNGDIWHTHDKYIQVTQITVAGNILNVLNTHILPITIFGHEMTSPLGKKLYKVLENKIKQLKGNVILTGDFNNKDSTPLSTILSDVTSLQFPTEHLVTAVVNPTVNHGSNIAVSSSFKILDCWSEKNYSDAYLLGMKIRITQAT